MVRERYKRGSFNVTEYHQFSTLSSMQGPQRLSWGSQYSDHNVCSRYSETLKL